MDSKTVNTSWHQYTVSVMSFRKPWVKSVNFEFSAKSSSTDYKSNKPIPKSLAHIESENSLVEFGVSKYELFHFFTFFALLKFTFHPEPWVV